MLAADLHSTGDGTAETTDDDDVMRLECFESALDDGAEGLRGGHADFVSGSFT